jgi:hypothetical protein
MDSKPLLTPDEHAININYITPKELQTINYLMQQKKEAKELEKKQPIPRKLILSLLFQIIFGGLVWGCQYIPDVEVDNDYVDNFLNGNQLPMGDFVLFYCLVILGFLCVSLVISNRKNPFLDRKGSPKVHSFIILFKLTC